MIEVAQLTKWYGPTLAVDRVSFKIEPGQIVGFLGPNGAGKSTTLRIITGYVPPTMGTASVAGHDVLKNPEAARASIGYLPESTPLYLEMRVEAYLDYRGRLLKMDRKSRKHRIGVVCERCGLSHIRRRVIGHLSRGNRQRVGIAQALLNEPPVLILDEPTAGLDPNQIGQVRKLIRELRGKHTILLSTHILPEIEKIADRVMIIAGGRIVADDSPEQLRQNIATSHKLLVEVQSKGTVLAEALRSIDKVKDVQVETSDDGWSRATVTAKGKADLRASIGRTLQQRNLIIRELRHEGGSLEEFFIQITAPPEASQTPQAPQVGAMS